MKLIIKTRERVLSLSLDQTDLRAILLAAVWIFHPSLPLFPMHDLTAGSGGLPQVWTLVSSQIR